MKEELEGSLFFCYEQTTTCIPINSMNKGRTKCKAIILSPEIILSKFDEGNFFGFMIPWVNIYPRWFIYDEQIFVLVQDIKFWTITFL